MYLMTSAVVLRWYAKDAPVASACAFASFFLFFFLLLLKMPILAGLRGRGWGGRAEDVRELSRGN